MSEEPTKNCEICGTCFDRSVVSGNRIKFAERKTCSRKCADEMRRRRSEVQAKKCEQCEKEFTRKKETSRAEFEKRRFCGTDCTYAFRRGTNGDWRNRTGAGTGQIKVIRAKKPRPIEGAPVFPEGHPKELWRPQSWGGAKPLPERETG